MIEGGLYFLWCCTGAEIAGGKLVIDVSYFGWHIHSETHDLCEETSCPVSTGDFVVSHTQVLPGFTPPVSNNLIFFINHWWLYSWKYLHMCVYVNVRKGGGKNTYRFRIFIWINKKELTTGKDWGSKCKIVKLKSIVGLFLLFWSHAWKKLGFYGFGMMQVPSYSSLNCISSY